MSTRGLSSPNETNIKAPKSNPEFGRVIIDSGAAVTVTSKKELIHNYRSFSQIERDEKFLEGPSKERLNVEGEGILKLRFGDYLKEINVTYSPGIPSILISLGHLDKEGVKLIDKQLICEDSIDHIEVFLQRQLFMIDPDNLEPVNEISLNSVETRPQQKITSRRFSLRELHEMFGHISISSIIASVKNGEFSDITVKNIKNITGASEFQCQDCLMNKAEKHKHKRGSRDIYTEALQPFEISHTDVWGPVHGLPVNIPKYAITFIDEKSSYRFVYPLMTKTDQEVCDVFEELVRKIRTQFGVRIKRIQMYREYEYTNRKMRSLLSKFGIIPIYTSTEDSRSHGVAEGYNKIMLNDVRTNLDAAGFNKKFCFFASKYSTMMINHMFMPKLKKSPHSYVLNQPTKVLRITKFGSKCVVYEPKTKSKLDRRGLVGKILMFDEEWYGYVIILDNGRMIESKNVRMLNQTQEYDNLLDFSDEPEYVDLNYIAEYPDIFDFDETDDDILEVENIIEDETPKVVEKDVEQDYEATTSNHDDKLASINESIEHTSNKIGVEKDDDQLDVGSKPVEIIREILEKTELETRVDTRSETAEQSYTDQ